MYDYQTLSPDLLAYLNPALAAVLLVEFCREYGRPTPMVNALVSAAIVLDPDLRESMDSTNRATGLFGWLEKRSDVPALARARMPANIRTTRDGMQLALSAGTLLLDVHTATLAEAGQKPLAFRYLRHRELAVRVRLIRRLAAWNVALGEPHAYLRALGVTLV